MKKSDKVNGVKVRFLESPFFSEDTAIGSVVTTEDADEDGFKFHYDNSELNRLAAPYIGKWAWVEIVKTDTKPNI